MSVWTEALLDNKVSANKAIARLSAKVSHWKNNQTVVIDLAHCAAIVMQQRLQHTRTSMRRHA